MGAAAAAMWLALAAAPAAASVVFDTGAPRAGAGGNEATQWVQADRFTLGADAMLTGGGIWIGGFGNIDAWDGSFDYWIFGDNAVVPGTALFSGAATVTGTSATVGGCCGGNSSLVTFDFAAPVSLFGSAPYWLGVHLAEDFLEIDDIYWVDGPNNAQDAAESRGGTFDNWQGESSSKAFYLEEGDMSVIPLPAALPLLAFGLARLFGLRRLSPSRV
jgi:hypothetical protein